MDRLGNLRFAAVALHDLLHAPNRERREPRGLEKVAVLWIGSQMGLKHQAKALGEEDVAVLLPFSLVDKNLALFKVDVSNFDLHQFANAHSSKEEKLQHDFVLKVSALLDDTKEPS
jgi:hypothetical protein